MSNFKEDLVLKATLGPVKYEKIKKHIAQWRSDYLSEQSKGMHISWNDYLTMKMAELENMKDWRVYQDDQFVGSTKACSAEDAISKFATIYDPSKLKARMVSKMTF